MIEVPMEKRTYRIGHIGPASNATMESEIPALLRAREGVTAQIVENRLRVPLTSTAICVARGVHDRLGLDSIGPNAGAGFSDRYGLACARAVAG
jgi:hypothetical protein